MWTDFHKEHVYHDGLNDISNCIPSCKECNVQKWVFKLNEWYNDENVKYDEDRMTRIIKWLENDHKVYL